MNYQVLARRLRPQNFTEMIGQEHVTRALLNAIKHQRLHHAYLFSGTRGVGKTTIARILAKCLNCVPAITANPCGKCSACQEIDQGRFVDLIEIDAASRTKVEDTREILDNVQYRPAYGRYKIYLIDEVHMLSNHSFNALLKTLEEPPEHVKFLLATTDPQKLPVTILSRCLQFNLKLVPTDIIAQYLARILTKEQIPYEELALEALAKSAKGSIRDALSLLDQAIAYTDHNLKIQDVCTMLGTTPQDKLQNLLYALADNDANGIFNVIQELSELAVDFNLVLEELLELLHTIAIAQFVSGSHESINLFGAEDLQLYYQIALTGRRDLPFAPTPKSGFEMLMLRMLAFRPLHTETDNSMLQISRVNPIENTTTPISATAKWEEILPKLDLSAPTKALAAHCSLVDTTTDQMHLHLSRKFAPLWNQQHEARLTEAISKFVHKSLKIFVEIVDNVEDTPHIIAERDLMLKSQQAKESFQNNLNVQKLLHEFDATLMTDTILIKEEKQNDK